MYERTSIAVTIAHVRAGGDRDAAVMDRRRQLIVAIACAATLGGCASAREGADGVRRDQPATVEARLGQSGGSAAKGVIRFSSSTGGLTTSIYVYSLGPGDYRMVIHTTGNCSSPNLFSAGPPWVAPGAAGPTVIEFAIGDDGGASLVRGVGGLTINGSAGVAGRAVVIHEGRTGTLETEPGRPNNRVACGVIGPVTSLRDLF